MTVAGPGYAGDHPTYPVGPHMHRAAVLKTETVGGHRSALGVGSMCMGAPTTLDGWTTSGGVREYGRVRGRKKLGPGAGRSWPHEYPIGLHRTGAWPRSRGGKLGI
jgi:hypothetical protein